MKGKFKGKEVTAQRRMHMAKLKKGPKRAWHSVGKFHGSNVMSYPGSKYGWVRLGGKQFRIRL